MPSPGEKPTDAIRTFFTQQCAALTEMMGSLSEPYLSQFKKLKDQYDSVLKSLPVTDQVPAAMEASQNLQSVFSVLASNQSLLSYLSGEVASLKNKHDAANTANAALTQRCSEFDAKIAAGDLIEKTLAAASCSAAKTTGIEEGKAAVRAEIAEEAKAAKVITDRKTQLAADKLPMPAVDALLAGDEAAFTAKKTEAVTRTEALKKLGFAQNSKVMTDLVWASAEEYTRQLGFATSILNERTAPSAAFITAPQGDAAKVPGGAY